MDINEILAKLNGLLYDIGRLSPNGSNSYGEDNYSNGFKEAREESYGLVNIMKYWVKYNLDKERNVEHAQLEN